MKIRWSRLAALDIRHVHRYIAADNRSAADAMVERIHGVVAVLSSHPQAGRAGRVAGTRELVVAGTPYIVVYSAGKTQIGIVAVLHAARKWPEEF